MLVNPLVCVFLVVSFITPTVAQEIPTYLKNGRPTRVAYGNLSYMGSADSITTIAQAVKHLNAGRFTTNNTRDLNLGIAKDNYWIHFTLVSDIAMDANVLLENPRLNEVDIFILRNDSVESLVTMGDNFPYDKRIVDYNQFVFPVRMETGRPVEIFLYLRHKGNTLQMPVVVMDYNALIARAESGYLTAGISTGVFCITFFFGIFFLFNTRDPLFIYYSGYILSAGVWLWATEGYGFQYLWPAHPELATRLGPGISAVSACFFIACCLQFCKPYDPNSFFRKALLVVLALLIVWTALPFLPFVPVSPGTMSVYLTVYFASNLFLAIALSVYLLQLSGKGHRIVLYYFSAVAVTMLSSFLIVLRGGGVINLPVSSGVLMSGGYILEIILMTAGITKQFYNYKKERENTLLVYLEQQKFITQKILETLEIERKRIGRELHDDIGSGLTQIALMSEAAKLETGKESKNLRELNDIAATTRNLVTSIGEIIWALNPENKTLGQLLIYIREQLNKLLEYSGMQYSIEFPPGRESLTLDNIQLRNILLITKEVVNNSVKYSRARNISIKSRIEDDTIHFEIFDDGIGMDLEKVRVRNGLKNIRLRASEIGGNIHITSKPGEGTRCHYQIPFQQMTRSADKRAIAQ
jgi:signal transduction histidine kinase